jgi:hypothetical protein
MAPPSGALISEPMAGAFQGLAERVSGFLSRHRLPSFLFTAVALVLVADAIRRALSGSDAAADALTWAALGLMAYAVVAVLFLQRRAPDNVRLVVAWFIGLSPALYGMTATIVGSPLVVMWIGVALAIGLVGWVALRPA